MSKYAITSGTIAAPVKTVLYGPEGIGKSTFAAQFPAPVFIDTEGGTKRLNVARLPAPTSWGMLLDEVAEVSRGNVPCGTLVIDTADWAERLCIDAVCARAKVKGIEDFGYGKGYTYAKEEFGKLLDALEEVLNTGHNVVVLAHAAITKFEQPDAVGNYDRWTMKTSKQVAPLLREWCDMLLFANYKTFSIAVDDKGKKRKAQGGERVMYTSHNACWDAKNRFGLPDEVPFDYKVIQSIIEQGKASADMKPYKAAEVPKTASAPEPVPEAPKPTTPEEVTGEQMNLPLDEPPKAPDPAGENSLDPEIPKALRDLMETYHVDEWDVENVVEAKGYVPVGTKIKDYDVVNPGIIEGLLVACWDQVYAAIKEMKEKQEIPFN